MKVNPDIIGDIFAHLFVLAIGMLFLIPASFKLYAYLSFRHDSTPTIGTVTKAGMGQYLGSRPFVQYSDTQGNLHEIKSEVNFYWFFAPRKGDRIHLLMQNNNPDSAIISSFFHYIAMPLFLILVGAATLIRQLLNTAQYIAMKRRIS